MTFAVIMVSVDFEPTSKSRITLAARLALRFKSLLIGVAAWPLIQDGRDGVAANQVPSLGSVAWVSKELARLEEKFRSIAGEITDRIEWRSSMDVPREVIPKESRAADLVVIGQDFLPGDVYHTYDPGTVILAAGRPVLVIPRQISQLEASRVLIAWKDTREARRAVSDALPFLREAKEVRIAMAQTQGATDNNAQMADIARYLARHQVSVDEQISTVTSDQEENLVLDLAKQHRADLIVAGAYGRTRLSEWIFGGVTRYLLLNSPVPCLFSN
jgi:nucleotide-binding universal stress UspA family protein